MRLKSRLRALLLALLALHGFSTAPLIAARLHVARQDHDRNHYYAMHLASNIDPRQVASTLGLTYEGCLGELDHHYLFSLQKSTDDPQDPLAHSIQKRSFDESWQDLQPAILYLEHQKLKKHHKRWPLVPRQDEIPDLVQQVARALQITDPLFPSQWHLLNPLQQGHDLNVTGVWAAGHFGQNITVAIVDDGLDMDSLDLAANFSPEGSYDFNDHVALPKPRLADDRHGTRCAGEIAAVRNEVCGVGVAYQARVAGIRILSGEISDADEAVALNYAQQENDIYSCSWGPPDDGKAMDAPGLLIKRAFVTGVTKGRGGLGSIYVFASGNGGAQEDNCNFDGYTNSIYSITVGAVDRMGRHPFYSELCSAQMVVAYSSGSGDYIHTTDVGHEKCTDKHGGTSAAAPLAAGIFALALGVRPDLTWRDLQQLCVDTAQMVDEMDSDWETVANGRKFNHKYGFGKLDAYKLVEAAKTFEHVKPQAWHHSKRMELEYEIPDTGDAVGSTIMVTEDDLRESNLERVEHVQVKINLSHRRRGDVVVDLVSPEGVVSRLATARSHDRSTEGMVDWYFMSVKHWYPLHLTTANPRGSSGIGNWTVNVRDVKSGSTGKWHNWQLLIWGSSIDASKAKPHPLPGTDGNPAVTTAIPVPANPPQETEPDQDIATPTTPPTGAPQSGFWSWSLDRKWTRLYGSIAAILLFVSGVGIWYGCYRRKERILETRGVGREDYEFEVLPNDGDDGSSHRRAGELYDAFAEFVNRENDEGDERTPWRSGEGLGDREMDGFLADSDDDENI